METPQVTPTQGPGNLPQDRCKPEPRNKYTVALEGKDVPIVAPPKSANVDWVETVEKILLYVKEEFTCLNQKLNILTQWCYRLEKSMREKTPIAVKKSNKPKKTKRTQTTKR